MASKQLKLMNDLYASIKERAGRRTTAVAHHWSAWIALDAHTKPTAR